MANPGCREWAKMAPPSYDELRLAEIVSNGRTALDSGLGLQVSVCPVHVSAGLPATAIQSPVSLTMLETASEATKVDDMFPINFSPGLQDK